MAWWLEAGTDGSDRLDLMSGATGDPGYMVLAHGFTVEDDPEQPDRYQVLTVPLTIKGTSRNDLLDRRRLIEAKLNQASQRSQAASGQPWVNIAIRLHDASTLVRWQVVSGTLEPGGMHALHSNRLGNVQEPAMLRLRCLRGGLGEPIELGPFSVSADNPTLHLPGIPGDEPALVEMRVRDTSTGAAINRMRVGARSLEGMGEGDFNPVFPIVGNTMVEWDDSFSGEVAAISASQVWQNIGIATPVGVPAGVYDLIPRVIDESTPLDAPSLDSAIVIQGPYVRQWAGERGSTGTEISVAFNQDSLGGSTLVAALVYHSADTPNIPAGWLHIFTRPVSAITQISVYYMPDAPATQSVAVGLQNINLDVRLDVLEVAGVAASSLDRHASSNQTTTTTTHPTGTTSATQFAHELLIAIFSFNTILQGGISVPSPWSNVGATVSSATTRVYSRIVTTIGAQSTTATTVDSRASGSGILTFRAAQAEPPALPAGGYTFWITAVNDPDGVESAPSLPFSVTLHSTSAVEINWTAPANGDFTSFRVYWQRDENPIEFVNTGSTATTYLLNSETDADSTSPADPPMFSQESAWFRLATRLAGADDDPPSRATTTVRAFGAPEPLYLQRSHLAPISNPLAASVPGYSVSLHGQIGRGNAAIYADALFLMPADEQQIDVQYTPGDLTTPREWVFGTTPDLRSYAFLRDLDTGEVAGRAMPVGYALLGPGDTTVVMLMTTQGGVWRIEGVSVEVSLTIVPRYRWLAGHP